MHIPLIYTFPLLLLYNCFISYCVVACYVPHMREILWVQVRLLLTDHPGARIRVLFHAVWGDMSVIQGERLPVICGTHEHTWAGEGVTLVALQLVPLEWLLVIWTNALEDSQVEIHNVIIELVVTRLVPWLSLGLDLPLLLPQQILLRQCGTYTSLMSDDVSVIPWCISGRRDLLGWHYRSSLFMFLKDWSVLLSFFVIVMDGVCAGSASFLLWLILLDGVHHCFNERFYFHIFDWRCFHRWCDRLRQLLSCRFLFW